MSKLIYQFYYGTLKSMNKEYLERTLQEGLGANIVTINKDEILIVYHNGEQVSGDLTSAIEDIAKQLTQSDIKG